MSSAALLGVAVALAAAVAAVVGAGLGWLSSRLSRLQRQGAPQTQMVERINAQLPQLQCGDCGYPGCRPYAAAIAGGETDITLCPPGGADTVRRLAELLNTPPPAPQEAAPPQRVAQIDAAACVGCALCLPACPTDAIIGAPRHLHTVVAADCVGCELCLPPCPVDCIRMVDADDIHRHAG